MKNFEKRKKATDMELASFLMGHINNPCEDLQGNNVRGVYIREARRVLKTFQNPLAKQLLENTIKRYSK